jgi:hypothetical protein
LRANFLSRWVDHEMTVLFGDAATDIAILKVDGNDFSALSLAASSAVKTGNVGKGSIQETKRQNTEFRTRNKVS